MINELEESYYEIGKTIFQPPLGARKPSKIDYIERGKQWLLDQRKELCQVIKSENVQLIFKGSGDQNEEQIRTLIDIFVSLKFGVPPSALAKAVIILGENWFCNPHL